MNKKNLVVFIAVLSLITLSSKGSAEAPTTSIEVAPIIIKQTKVLSPIDHIYKWADFYEASDQDKLELKKVGWCESNLGRIKTGDKGLATGLFMYHKGTWAKAQDLIGEDLDIHSINDQAKMTAFIWKKYPSWRTQWSTYVAYKKGGVYSFHSRVLNGDYTVRCK